MRVVYNIKVQAAVKEQILLSAFLSALSLSLYAGFNGTANSSAYAQPADTNALKTRLAEHTANTQQSRTWQEHNKRACELWKSKLYTQAQSEAIEACRLAPNEATAHTNLAAVMQGLSALPDAISQYEAALRIAPNNLRARIGLAQCLAIIGNRKASLRTLAVAAGSSGSDPQVVLAIGQLYSKLGLHQLAINTIHNSLNGLSDSHEDRQIKQLANECLLLSALKAKDTKLATQLFEEVLINSPSDPQVYIESVKYLCTRTSIKEAQQILASAIKDKSYCAQLFFELTQIFESKAGLCLESTDTSDHQLRNIWLNLAEQSLRQSILANPNEAKYRIALAGCLDMQNKSSEAVSVLTSVTPSKHDVVHFDKSDLGTGRNNLAANFKSFLFNRNDLEQNSQSIYLRCLRFNIENLSCGCRLNDLESRLRAKYGVVCVNVFHDGSHGGMIVYNPKKTTFKSSISRVLKGNEKANVVYDSEISTIEQLASVALAHTTTIEPPLLASIVALPPQ